MQRTGGGIEAPGCPGRRSGRSGIAHGRPGSPSNPVKQVGELVELVDLLVEVDLDLIGAGCLRVISVANRGVPEGLASRVLAVEPVQQLP